ncbi:MAG: hypothetical protein Q8K92_04615 [Leadbetterella sp.]|nr:hypothetical protein [Leadbetterella sp.]
MSQLIKSKTDLGLSQIGSEIITTTQLTPYDTRIARDRPACFLFLIDQSGSMNDHWANSTKTKAELVADYVNNGINELINICQKSESKPIHYFDICVIGYGQNDEDAQILWQGNLSDKIFVSPADLKDNPTGNQGEIEVERRTFKGVSTVKIPISYWFSPVAATLTPMGAAIDLGTKLLTDWVSEHQNSFPPIVINITDGEQTDCENDELIQKAFNLKQTKTLYGNTLLFNIHITSDERDSVLFPSSLNDLPKEQQCETLYNMSSNLPEIFNRRIAQEIKKVDLVAHTQYVALGYQTSISHFIKFLDIGTKTVKI